MTTMEIPVVSLKGVSLEEGPNSPAWINASAIIHKACKEVGFFSIRDYAMPEGLEEDLDTAARGFFQLPEEQKDQISMRKGGRAWRGWFPVGNESTSGKPDIKEGIYFGEELTSADRRVQGKWPMHGQNLFPSGGYGDNELRSAVLTYMACCKRIGDVLISLIGTQLGFPHDYFLQEREGICQNPLQLFRIFHYPPTSMLPDRLRQDGRGLWGVGEHTDYGLLTLLKQDLVGGLEVKGLNGEWVPVQPKPEHLVVNLGDMLEAVTRGLYRSTPHRVKNANPNAMRLSFPFFYDPGFDTEIRELPLNSALVLEAEKAVAAKKKLGQKAQRWDSVEVSEAAKGGTTYGQYILNKVGKCFPELATSHL